MTQKRELRPVLTKDLTSAIEQVIVDAQDAGVDLEDIDDSPRLEGRLRQDDNALNELVSLKSQGNDIPGQSLVNSPEQKYPWESPPQFSNPRIAVKEIRTAGRNTQGVRIIKLSGEEKVVSANKIDDNLI